MQELAACWAAAIERAGLFSREKQPWVSGASAVLPHPSLYTLPVPLLSGKWIKPSTAHCRKLFSFRHRTKLPTLTSSSVLGDLPQHQASHAFFWRFQVGNVQQMPENLPSSCADVKYTLELLWVLLSLWYLLL